MTMPDLLRVLEDFQRFFEKTVRRLGREPTGEEAEMWFLEFDRRSVLSWPRFEHECPVLRVCLN